MIDLGVQSDIERIYTAMDSSRDAMRPFRENRQEMIRQYVGSRYNDDGAPYPVLVNLLGMTADVYTIGLAANCPRCRVQTPYRDLWPFAYRWETALNNFIKEMRFEQTMQQIVLDAFFSVGVAKVFQADWHPVQLDDDVWADPGRPYIGRVSFDDFGLDMSVKDTRKCRFMWDEYRVGWDSVANDPDFDPAVVKQLAPTSKHERGEEDANSISAGAITDDDEYEPMVDLMDVWLPEIGKVAVFPRHSHTKPLKVMDEGPEGGPYELLTFADVPDNVLPTTPAQNLMDLHLLYNGLMRKQSRQAKRQKTNPTYTANASGDAERIKKANDGEWIKVNDPKTINVINQGGVDQTSVAFSIGVLDLFDRQAGNLQAMAGLGAQTGTVGQEELIHSAVSRKEAKMQDRVHTFTARVLQSLGHLMWADAVLEVPGSFEVAPRTGIYEDAAWTPELREGDFWQYNFDIQPYSMNYEPPEAKIQKIERAMQQIMQLYPVLEAVGGTIDVQELVKQYADSLQLPELENVVTFATPSNIERPGPQGSDKESPKTPTTTTRNYVRRNIPTGGTSQSRSSILQQSFLGGEQTTPQQRESMTRPGA